MHVINWTCGKKNGITDKEIWLNLIRKITLNFLIRHNTRAALIPILQVPNTAVTCITRADTDTWKQYRFFSHFKLIPYGW